MMIATILKPGNQVIDWSRRKLYLYSCQGSDFSLSHMKSLSSLVSIPPASLLADSRKFMLPPPPPPLQQQRGKEPRTAKNERKCTK